MARLSKAQIGDRGRFQFKQEEVPLPELSSGKSLEELESNEEDADTVLVRVPSLKQRDEMSRELDDDPTKWNVDDAALLASVMVVDPKLSRTEWAEFIGDWPGPAFDRILDKFTELIGTQEDMRQAAGDFQPSN